MDCQGLFWSWGWTDVGARVRVGATNEVWWWTELDGAEHQIYLLGRR